MKKLMLVLMTGLFVLGLTSCEEKKDQPNFCDRSGSN